jgi:hypothetical protein
MDNYPNNSSKAKAPVEEKTEAKKIDPVVTGGVTRRKAPLGKRLAETFIGGDAKTVGGYVFFEVLIPAARDMITDAITQGVERMVYGEVRSVGRRTGTRPSGQGGYVSYNRIAQSNNRPRTGGLNEFQRREPDRRARASHDFDDIIIPTRAEAQAVIERLYDILEQYEQVSVSELYELVGITPNYTDGKWGWVQLTGSDVTKVRDGYLLELPKPVALEP